MTGREASIFACLTDAVVAPRAPLPPVSDTDAVQAFDRYLDACPWPNRLLLRASLRLLEHAPQALGYGGRMRRLTPESRARYVGRLESGRLEPLAKALRGIAQFSYYGDDRVMRLLGYDPGAQVARGRALRISERRW